MPAAETRVRALDSAAWRSFNVCCRDADPAALASSGGLGVGQTQPRILRRQDVQMGLTSSHFFLRRRKVKQPVSNDSRRPRFSELPSNGR